MAIWGSCFIFVSELRASGENSIDSEHDSVGDSVFDSCGHDNSCDQGNKDDDGSVFDEARTLVALLACPWGGKSAESNPHLMQAVHGVVSLEVRDIIHRCHLAIYR